MVTRAQGRRISRRPARPGRSSWRWTPRLDGLVWEHREADGTVYAATFSETYPTAPWACVLWRDGIQAGGGVGKTRRGAALAAWRDMTTRQGVRP